MTMQPGFSGGRDGFPIWTQRACGVGLALALVGGWLAAGGAARAQTCPATVSQADLVQPRLIRPRSDGVLDTALVVRKNAYPCIPVWRTQDRAGKQLTTAHWEWRAMTLRTYFSPRDGNNPNDPTFLPSLPGPTLRLRKATLKNDAKPPGADNPEVSPGNRLRLKLTNDLDNNSYPYDQCDPAKVVEPTTKKEYTEQYPQCFHGAEVTNIHYHGTHASPQPHGDFVLLSLFSARQTNPKPPSESEFVKIGSYQTELAPLPWNQPPGTHLYHAHKHGATSLQLLNGMAGGLVIEGPFDDWLYGIYRVNPRSDAEIQTFEKLLIVQQVLPELSYYNQPAKPNYPPQPLIDRQANPTIKIRYGEVQRWRFVGATMQASAQLEITLPTGFTLKQIAQDGIQFAPDNWNSQPLIQGTSFNLGPGNRADFLVQAPPMLALAAGAKAPKQTFAVTAEVVGNVAGTLKKRLQLQSARPRTGLQAAATPDETKALFTIEVDGEVSPAMELPTTWPETPYYLRNITDAEVAGRQRTVAFSMTDPKTGIATVTGVQANGFWIDKTRYDHSCANETMALGTAEEWTVSNDSGTNHPFHIHTNPYQVLRNDTTTFKTPIWQDTLPLPLVACQDANAGPLLNQQDAAAKCPGVCGL